MVEDKFRFILHFKKTIIVFGSFRMILFLREDEDTQYSLISVGTCSKTCVGLDSPTRASICIVQCDMDILVACTFSSSLKNDQPIGPELALLHKSFEGFIL